MCGGLWVTKCQLEGRVDPDTSRRLFHGGDGRATGMRCPMDHGLLFEFDVNGVLLDRCNHCGGLWFDAGELRAVLGAVRLGECKTRPRKTPYLDDASDLSWWMEIPGVGEVIADIIGSILSP